MMMPHHEFRAWLARIALSLAVALGGGALAYLVARAATSVALFMRQQQFLAEVASALRGGVEGLPSGNLRAMRQLVQRIDAQNELLSLLIGFAVAGLAALVTYLWLERRAAKLN